jgi:hypothetical protein
MTADAKREINVMILALQWLKKHRPDSCKSYESVCQDPLFKAIKCDLLGRYGITEAILKKHVDKQLHVSHSITLEPPRPIIIEAPLLTMTEPPRTAIAEPISTQENYDELLVDPMGPEAKRIACLPSETQKKIWGFWVAKTRGLALRRAASFNRVWGNTMELMNEELVTFANANASPRGH